MSGLRRETYERVTGRLAKQFQTWGVDKPEEKAVTVSKGAAVQADHDLKRQQSRPKPDPVDPSSAEQVAVREEIEVDGKLLRGFQREVEESITGGRSTGAPSIMVRDTPMAREYWASRGKK